MDPQPCQPQLPAQRAARDQVSRALGGRAGGPSGWQASGGLERGLRRGPARPVEDMVPPDRPRRPFRVPLASASSVSLRPQAMRGPGDEEGLLWGDFQGPEWLLISPRHSRPSVPSPHAQLLPGLGFHSPR